MSRPGFGGQVISAFYNPAAGRWLSKDPIRERGGISLFAFVGNAPVTFNDKLGLDINSPPIGAPGITPCKACCCCVDDLKIENVAMINGWIPDVVGGPYWGDEFDVRASLRYVRASLVNALASPCTIQWLEKGDSHMPRGVPTGVWIDVFAFYDSKQEQQWNNREQPCPGTKDAVIHDTPAIPIGQTDSRNASRHLEIEITVTSSPGCLCLTKSRTVRVTQDLVFDSKGQPTFSSFTVE